MCCFDSKINSYRMKMFELPFKNGMVADNYVNLVDYIPGLFDEY